jgi:putative flippase GtrA
MAMPLVTAPNAAETMTGRAALPQTSLFMPTPSRYRNRMAVSRDDLLTLIAQFLRFGVVGAAGFLVDTSVVYATRGLVGLYWAGAIAYPVAASGNWLLNRYWTFRGPARHAVHVQWLRFLAVNLVGFALNRGTYFILITISSLCHDMPVLAVAAGAIAGLGANFCLSRRLVFI